MANNQRQLYFIKNNLTIPKRYHIYDSYCLIKIVLTCYEDDQRYGEGWGDIKYFYLRENQNATTGTEISIIDGSKNIFKFQIFDNQNITFHDKEFNFHEYLVQQSAIAINIVNSDFECFDKYLYWNNFVVKIHVFPNVIIVLTDETICPRYFVSENNEFSVITDKNFIVFGFVIHNIMPSEINFLENYALRSGSINNEESPFLRCHFEKINMENKNCLINKILELENVNQWEIIYYGLERHLIDTTFIMDYCYALIEQKDSKDQFVLDIAALTDKDELYHLATRIKTKISNHDEVMITKGQQYNKIWFYLSLAADLCAEKIIQ